MQTCLVFYVKNVIQRNDSTTNPPASLWVASSWLFQLRQPKIRRTPLVEGHEKRVQPFSRCSAQLQDLVKELKEQWGERLRNSRDIVRARRREEARGTEGLLKFRERERFGLGRREARKASTSVDAGQSAYN